MQENSVHFPLRKLKSTQYSTPLIWRKPTIPKVLSAFRNFSPGTLPDSKSGAWHLYEKGLYLPQRLFRGPVPSLLPAGDSTLIHL